MDRNKAVIAGGRRIVQNKKRLPPLSSNELKYVKSIESCNEKINKMKDNDYIKFRDHSTQLISQVCKEIKRDHFSNRDEYRKYKDEKLKYIFTLLFYPVNEMKILFKKDNFKTVTKYFNKTGLKLIGNIVSSLENCVVERKYDIKDEKHTYNEAEFKTACNTLGIDNEEKLLFSKIRTAYNNKIENAGGNDEEKENVNLAFILIRDQYENYLKSFSNIETDLPNNDDIKVNIEGSEDTETKVNETKVN